MEGSAVTEVLQNPAVLALTLLVGLVLPIWRKSPGPLRILLLSGLHLLGLIVWPLLPGPEALRLGVWDGLFGLALLALLHEGTRGTIQRLQTVAIVAAASMLTLLFSAIQPATGLPTLVMQGAGLVGFLTLSLQLQSRQSTAPALLALACGLLGWTGPDQFLMLGLKSGLVVSLITAEANQERALSRRLEEQLVHTANQLELPFRMTAQALFHVPVPLLLIEPGSRDVLYANGLARSTLNGCAWSRRPLPELFLALHPSGPQQEDGLVLEADRLIRRVLVHAIPAPGEAGPLEIVSLSQAPLHSEQLARLLIEDHVEIQGHGRCLTDGRFSIIAASVGWQQHFGRLDRYFQSGSIWDKLRMSGTHPSEWIQGEIELERDKRATIRASSPRQAPLILTAIGFRDTHAAWWYLFEARPSESPQV